MLASLDEVSKSYGDQHILLDASAKVHEQDRIGLIGRNGAGKTTLIRVLLGLEEPDEGEVFVRGDMSIGYMRQDSGLEADSTVADEMHAVFAKTLEAQTRMEDLASEIEKNPEDETLQKKYDAAMSEFLAGDGYNIEVKIRRVLAGMGFAEKADDTVISTMSGGEKTRLALARLLLMEPDLLILDEPTNHLDMRTLSWLEEYLSSFKGALLIVSHDRFFLDRVTNATWEIEDGFLDAYKGSYTSYRTQREARKKEQLREYEKQQVKIAELKDYIARNIVRASTAPMAKSRQKVLEKMERIPKPRLHSPSPKFTFEAAKRPWSEVLDVEDLDLRVGDENRIIVEDVSFEVRRGDRLGVIGPNGTGKSTLLRTLLAAPEEHAKNVTWGRGTECGYYEQENRNLRPEATAVSEVCRRIPGTKEGEARQLLGKVLLTGEDAFKQVKDLSGGERAKLGLAILMGQQANVLLLDEPTNHLDLPSREALEDALQRYDGTLIFVSHDRYFVNALADHVLDIEDGKANMTEGNFDAWEAAREERQLLLAAESQGAAPQAARPRQDKEQRRIRAERRQSLAALEKEIAALETEEKELRAAIEAGSSDYEVLQEACGRLEEVSAAHDSAMEKWLRLADENEEE